MFHLSEILEMLVKTALFPNHLSLNRETDIPIYVVSTNQSKSICFVRKQKVHPCISTSNVPTRVNNTMRDPGTMPNAMQRHCMSQFLCRSGFMLQLLGFLHNFHHLQSSLFMPSANSVHDFFWVSENSAFVKIGLDTPISSLMQRHPDSLQKIHSLPDFCELCVAQRSPS